jgi:hypothetical protein
MGLELVEEVVEVVSGAINPPKTPSVVELLFSDVMAAVATNNACSSVELVLLIIVVKGQKLERFNFY